ncbi:Cof-type HAD-IIB family hydrolase [Virgibacillus halodenitrificans]|uniref:Cof-type HAD-IIB family hydrolase n=1 Tax=Virgibacillus halodenitrificans TaxID=1482 RepID=UPI0024BFB159|nr:Cof-type HAD-IIB family hydrolase [Virgibacillus halodenitrificans]WHX26720.1 Cof-type HAD-IIB family hydrolase [Virgibacillus halodenitrificans]
MEQMKKEIKLVALDMDGTLLTNEHEISDYTKKVIEKALEKGVHVVLSTGRWLQSCYPYAVTLKLPSYLVTSNGGEIYTVEKEIIEQHLLDADKMEKMWTLGKEIGLSMWIVSTEGVFRETPPGRFQDYKWLKFGCDSYDKEKLDKMVKELSYIEGLELTNSLPTNLEANPKGVSKASALETVCKKLDFTMQEVMAVGDSLNDMKMIQAAGIGVAMGNAQEAIKKAADYVTDTNNNDGVAKAIERFVL